MLVVSMAEKLTLQAVEKGTRGFSKGRDEMKEIMLSIVFGVRVSLTFMDVNFSKALIPVSSWGSVIIW